jgi:hypothetical protein
MRIDSVVPDCAKLPSPLLTVFVNTAGNDASRHPRERVDMAWFLDAADTLRHALSHRDAKAFERQANRVRRFLEQRHPAEKALVIFAGAKAWKVIPLEAPVIHELRWGKPNIAPLLPLLNGHRRYCAVVMDHFAARYFQYEHGELISLGTKEFEIDASQWKRKEQCRVATERVQNSRGPVRDLYEHRVEAQYKRLCHQVAGEAAALCKTKELSGLFLVGPDRLIQTVREKIPPFLAASTVVVQENLGRSSPKELQCRLEPLLDDYEQEQQLSAVKLLRASDQTARTNPDEVLAQLQNGRIRTLVVARDLQLSLRRCPKCGFATRAADRTCADCGAVRQEITLGELLAQVLATDNVKIEFVNGGAARLLLRTGGLGGWLRAQRAAAAV